MHERNQLRHLGHFHAIGSDRPNATPHDQSAKQQGKAIGKVGGRLGRSCHLGDGSQGRDNCDRHPSHAEGVATTGRRWVGKSFERLDQADRRDQVKQRDEVGVHAAPPPWEAGLLSAWDLAARGSLRRNISSMRRVTRKPPNTLTAASATASVPMV